MTTSKENKAAAKADRMKSEQIVSKVQKAYDSAKVCLETPDGHAFMDHLRDSFFHNTSAVAVDRNGNIDPNGTLVNEGARNVINYIQHLLDASPGQIEETKMMNLRRHFDQRRTGV